MIKQSYLQKLQEIKYLSLPIKEYAIWGSGVLAIRGLRAARDIDIVVKPLLWQSLIKKYPPAAGEYGGQVIHVGSIEIWNNLMELKNLPVNEVVNSAEMIEGYPFMSLHFTILWKKILNREKDLQDIALLEQWLLASRN